MTMLNEEIVKELSKYDDMFNGFSYNDIGQERNEEEEDKEEEMRMEDNPNAEGYIMDETSDDSDYDIGELADGAKNEDLGLKPMRKKSSMGSATGTKATRKLSSGPGSPNQQNKLIEKVETTKALEEAVIEPTMEEPLQQEPSKPLAEVQTEENNIAKDETK